MLRSVSMLRGLEERLVAGLELNVRALPPELGGIDIAYRGQPLSIRARAYDGVAFARFVEIASPGLNVVNALVLPRVGLPVFGVDLVETGAMVVTALDLSPLCNRDNERVGRALGGQWEADARDAAAWATPHLSIHALVRRERLEGLDTRLHVMAEAYLSLEHETFDDERAVRLRDYVRAHRDEQNGMKLIPKILGAALGMRFIDEVLFAY